uniref:ABC transmembrane type-1 domain-containing protein n=1 Tax=Macrostomum lignano TaxID=282301 RepID=A0A1I8HPC9_9PLAT
MYFSKFPHLILIENALSRVINRTEMASSRDTSSSSSASDRPLESTNFAIEIEPTSIQFSSAIHASAHDDTLQVRRFTPASRDLEPFHFLSSTKFAVLQAVEMRFDSSENNSIRAQLKFNIRMFLAGKMMRPMSFASLFLGFVPLARLFLYSCFATPAPMMLMMMVVVMRIVGLDTGVQFRTWTGS